LKLGVTGLTGNVLRFYIAVERALDTMRSVPCRSVATVGDLPPASANEGRIFIVDDIGGSVSIAVARNGVWKTGALT